MTLILNGTDNSATTPAVTGTDTDTGVYYPAANQVALATAGTLALLVDASRNIGLGVTPSVSTLNGLVEGAYGNIGFTSALGVSIAGNAYYDSSWKYKVSSSATLQLLDSGGFKWLTASAGTAGNAITFGDAKMALDVSGNLLVATTSAVSGAKVTIFANSSSSTDASYLTLSGTGENIGDINYTNAFGIMVRLRGTKAGSGGSSDEGYFEVKTAVNGTLTGGVYISAGGTAWTAVSDERKKENLIPITNAIAKVSSLRSVTGNYIEDSNKRSKAFLIAQDVLAVLPEAVDTTNPEQYGLAYTDTIPLLVAAIKEQQTLITTLTDRIAALEAK